MDMYMDTIVYNDIICSHRFREKCDCQIHADYRYGMSYIMSIYMYNV